MIEMWDRSTHSSSLLSSINFCALFALPGGEHAHRDTTICLPICLDNTGRVYMWAGGGRVGAPPVVQGLSGLALFTGRGARSIASTLPTELRRVWCHAMQWVAVCGKQGWAYSLHWGPSFTTNLSKVSDSSSDSSATRFEMRSSFEALHFAKVGSSSQSCKMVDSSAVRGFEGARVSMWCDNAWPM
jgi:hypothetical protein